MYFKFLLSNVLVLLMVSLGYAQGTVRGKIIDENGEDLIGVTIVFQNNPGVGTATDWEGNFSLVIPDDTPQILSMSYVGYQNLLDTVQVDNGETVVLDLVMRTESEALEEVVVVAKQDRAKSYYMEKIKRSSAITLDYMPAELMSKVGDSEISSAIARVSGVTTNSGFFSVRGIGDRYVKTTVNGSVIPTLDPFTNNVKLDLFPTSLVDNIIITKTQSPDLPGDWSAAYISVETKDYPDQLSVKVKTSIGVQAQSTFQDVLANQTSSTDWLGFDNNFREYDHSQFVSVSNSPTDFEVLTSDAVGLKRYYELLGVTESWDVGDLGNTYFKLGLVELGLLGKSFFNNEQEIAKAKAAFEAGNYRTDAFLSINQAAIESNRNFANNWNVFTEKAPINFSQSFSIGNRTQLFGKTVGYLLGFRYSNSVKYDENSTLARTLTSDLTNEGGAGVNEAFDQQIANYSDGWTALANFNMKLNDNNSVSLLFMPNFKGTNQIRVGTDTRESSTFRYDIVESQFYEERSQLVYQFKSKHFIPSLQAKINLLASYTDGASSAPDFKNINYFSDDLNTYFFDLTVSNPRRNFRSLDEDILDSRISVELPLAKSAPSGRISKLKFGGAYLEKQRDFSQYDYGLEGISGTFLGGSDLENFFSEENFAFVEEINPISGDTTTTVPLSYSVSADQANFVVGTNKVYAGYAMVDQSLGNRVRLSGGVRVEYTDIFTDVKEFAELGLAADDPRRVTLGQSFILQPGMKEQWNILPSMNFIYKIRPDEISPINLRLNYSRTIARPSIRELSETVVRDFELNADVFGNPDLEIVEIDNVDMRLETYFKNGDDVSVSLFYKNFKNHIELLSSNIGFTWANAESSFVYGVEIEGTKKLTKNFEFRANVSIVNSSTKIADRRLEITEDGRRNLVAVGELIERTMFGQAPFVVNGILNYNADKLGLNASLSYNLQGDKLVLTSVDAAPDVYELSQHLLNFKIGKSIGNHFEASFRVRNILDAPTRRAYNFDSGFLLDFDRVNFGPDFQISLAYKL